MTIITVNTACYIIISIGTRGFEMIRRVKYPHFQLFNLINIWRISTSLKAAARSVGAFVASSCKVGALIGGDVSWE
jgi:hypothetical protein